MSGDPELLQYRKITERAYPPVRATPLAAGIDLRSAHDVIIQPGKRKLIFTDLAFRIPPGYYGRVAPRSGLASKYCVDVGAGVIDSDYRGNVAVLLINFGEQPYNVSKGDRIAQLILEKIAVPVLCEVSSLDDTVRGSGGFGSTGV
ncbi:dUTP pyrophosphatase [Aviadenovirus bubonis]|nr:dUTP pyrophosphatase [Owl adenovirus]